MAEQPPAALNPQPADVPAEQKPIPFKPDELEKFKSTVLPTISPQTSYSDCLKLQGHGGAKGDRVYFPNPTFDIRTGRLSPGPRVCEICGMVDV